MRRAIYPGTFDPPHRGHLDVIERGRRLVGELLVAVGVNPAKEALFSRDERLELLRACTSGLDGVRVVPFDGLVVDLFHDENADFLIRGVRSSADLTTEIPMAYMNRHLEARAETVFVLPDPGLVHISSSLVKEVASFGRSVRAFLPEAIADRVVARLGVGDSDP